MNMGNKEEILSNALRLFSVRGYDAVGIKEIVDSSGITKPTLYHYFGSKNGLLTAILEYHFQRLFLKLSPAAVYHGDLPLTLTEIVRTYFDFARKNPEFYRLQLGLWLSPPESEGFVAVKEWCDKQQQLIEMVFMLAANNHGNMRNRHRIYTATFLGMINTLVGYALNGYGSLDENTINQSVKYFSHGIYS